MAAEACRARRVVGRVAFTLMALAAVAAAQGSGGRSGESAWMRRWGCSARVLSLHLPPAGALAAPPLASPAAASPHPAPFPIAQHRNHASLERLPTYPGGGAAASLLVTCAVTAARTLRRQRPLDLPHPAIPAIYPPPCSWAQDYNPEKERKAAARKEARNNKKLVEEANANGTRCEPAAGRGLHGGPHAAAPNPSIIYLPACPAHCP